MRARAFWKAVTVDRGDLLQRVVAQLNDRAARFCVIGGVAVNAYVEPVVTLDLDLVIAAADQPAVEAALEDLRIERFAHSVNISSPDSDLRVQIQTDSRYAPFIARAELRDVLGIALPVARIEDLLQGKVWAAMDPERRASKRQKDLADIARLLEHRPDLRAHVPAQVLDRLL